MSSSSREGSPDWLRSYEAPRTSPFLLSSPDDSPYRETETISSLPEPDDSDTAAIMDNDSPESHSRKNSKKKLVTKQVVSRKKKADASLNLEGKHNGKKVDNEIISSKLEDAQGEDDSVWLVSSDSEKDEDFVPQSKKKEPAVKKVPKQKSPKTKPNSGRRTPKIENSVQEILKSEDKDTNAITTEEGTTDKDAITTEEGTTDKDIKPSALRACGSNSRLPLVLSEKVNRTKVLVECEGDSVDLSGDMGAVGRVVISDTTEDVYLDLKGTIYKSTIVPSRTFCIVNVGQSEAKIEAIMNDFIQLTPQSNVFEGETMMEGTLEGYSFDSDNEADKNTKTDSKPADESEEATEVTNTKAKAKTKAKGENVLGKKRGRPSKDKPQPAKKARKSAPKKTKAKK